MKKAASEHDQRNKTLIAKGFLWNLIGDPRQLISSDASPEKRKQFVKTQFKVALLCLTVAIFGVTWFVVTR